MYLKVIKHFCVMWTLIDGNLSHFENYMYFPYLLY